MARSREWFALQLRCAERASAITGLSITDALLRFTAISGQLGLGYGSDPDHPCWQAYLRGLAVAADPAAYTAACCAGSEATYTPRPFGCFRYTVVPTEGRVRLHFASADPLGALGRERQAARRAELRGLFGEVATRYPAARTVRGNSWLHGIAAYRRLYPPEYVASAIAAPLVEEFAYMALWGQFLDHRGDLKTDLVERFVTGMAAARTLDELAAAVPCPVYEVECPIDHFYAFYGVVAPAQVAR